MRRSAKITSQGLAKQAEANRMIAEAIAEGFAKQGEAIAKLGELIVATRGGVAAPAAPYLHEAPYC